MAQKDRFLFRMFRVLKFPHRPPVCSLLSSPLSLSCLSPQGTSWARVRMPQFKRHTHPLQTATSVRSLGLGVHRLVDGPSVGSTAWGKRSTQTPEETCIHLESDLDERAQALGRHTLLPLWLPLCPSLRCRIAFFSRSSLSSSSHQHEERDYRGESPVFQSFNLEVMHIFSANIPLAKT